MRLPKCLCSRCSLYTRVADSDDPDDLLDGLVKSCYFEEREYQTSLINIAIKKNIIACLPTGSGKTYIAYKLIEHFQHDIASKGQKVFFLANTIPLVNQQAAFFSRNLTLKVKHITGDMEVDYWSPSKWELIINDCQILAMTSQIFLNIVRHAYIKLSQIALIIFDECHHAQNEHPMRMIMLEYHATKKADPNYKIPRILGLTATIIMGNCKPDEVPTRVRELESTMDSTAVTYRDYEAVMRHSTSATIKACLISSGDNAWNHTFFLMSLDSNKKELQILRKERKKLKANAQTIKGIDPTLQTTSNIYLCNKSPSPGDLRIAVEDVSRTYLDMGIYCTVIAINLRLAFIEFSLMDLVDATMKMWYNKIRTLFIEFRKKLYESMEAYSEEDRVTQFITPKLKKLIKILVKNFRKTETSNCSECGDDENDLCGLVFTDRRVTAQVLAWYLKDLARLDQKYSFLKANFVVGTSRCPFETVESRIYAKKQTATINGFRSKKFNILTATSVLEEGIDVPSCNLVVRFDPVKTYTSYIQSMGRARKKNALFYAFLDIDFYDKGKSNLDNFKAINEAMVSHLRDQVLKIDEEFHQQYHPFTEHSVEPFCPGGTPDSPRVTMESAKEVIENYCMLLPSDGISSLQTLSWWTEVNSFTFLGHLKLPMNSVVKGIITGFTMKSKELARQAVFFEAAKRLFEENALDDKLCPIRPQVPPKIEAFFTTTTPFTATGDEKEVNNGVPDGNADQDEDFASQLFRREWYLKKIPEIFQGSKLIIGERYKVYRICIELTEPNADYKWKNLYKLQNKDSAFGIICANEIPDIGNFPLFGVFGCLSVRLEEIPNFTVNLVAGNFHTLLNFQQIVFRDILDLGYPLFEAQKELSFTIVPLEKHNHSWRVYEKLFPRNDDPGINSVFTIGNTRPPQEESRKQVGRGNRFQINPINYTEKYRDGIVCPWYKGKSRPLYLVDTVELNMNPLTMFHDGNFSSYKNFYKIQYKKEIYNVNQPLLKCKMAGVGKGMKQLNYLLEKHAKEDEFPVYLVPELCFLLPIPSSALVQLKLLPSILHRLSRILLAKEILTSVGKTCCWNGLLSNASTSRFDPENIERLTMIQNYNKTKEEARRKVREEVRRRLKREHVPILQKKRIEDRELHYEFIHPNEITKKEIQLFHEAVSSQYSAKRLKLPNSIEEEMENEELSIPSKIELIDFDDIVLPLLDQPLDLNTNEGPSLLCLLEAITGPKSNEGISYERLKISGWSFLNCVISAHTFLMFPAWTEPLMCQLRNRLLSVQFLSTIAKKSKLGEILSGSGFYPDATWLPPGFELVSNIGEVAAEHGIHLGVYKDIINRVKRMTREELTKYVSEKAPILLKTEETKPTGGQRVPGSRQIDQPFIKFATYTHSELSNLNLADGLCALVGAFFTQSGSEGALKLLKWLGFCVPDLDGVEHFIDAINIQKDDVVTLQRAEELIPNLNKLETLIGYRFNNRKYLLAALSHPSYFANHVSDCYQRLEFLGDATLDCLLTNHIFSKSTKHDIEKLTEIRAALVNNVTYGTLSVRYELHKYMLSMSKPLLDMIDNFVVYQEAAEHRVIGHFTLISDEECWGQKHIEVPKVLGDLFEALAGAVYCDSKSLDTVWKIFYRLMQNEIGMWNSEYDFFEDVPMSPLRELKKEFPNPGQVVFKCCTSEKIRARGREMFRIDAAHLGHYYGTGTNKTRAKEAAAKLALKMCKDDDDMIRKFNGERIALLI